MRFFFIKEQDENNVYDTTRIIFEGEEVHLPAVLQRFAEFLKACGFSLPEKDFPIVVSEDEDEET